jgi:hypothetical protein
MTRHLFSLLLSGLLLAQPLAMAGTVPAKPAAVQSSSAFSLTLKQLGDADPVTLKTVRTERRYTFTKPRHWKALPQSALTVVFQHSAHLLPERSSLNVLVNNRIIRTIPLTASNVARTSLSIPIPPEVLKAENTLAFQVDQHYTYQCEDPFSSELWTTLLPETRLNLVYAPQKVVPDLAGFPYPLIDVHQMQAARVGFVALPGLSDDSLTALGTVAAGLGQSVSWRPYQPFLAAEPTSNDSWVMVGTMNEQPALQQLVAQVPVLSQHLVNGQWHNPNTGAPLAEGVGILALVTHPTYPDKALLIVSGNSPAGVLKAARALMQQPGNRLLTGSVELVTEQAPGPRHPFRQWVGFLQQGSATLAELGLPSTTVRGVTAPPVGFAVNLMPDLHLPGRGMAQLKTVYSYASQADPTQSKLEVLLNGKSLKSIPLNDKAGKNLDSFTLDIPASDLYTYNNLVYQFYLFPEKYDLCHFVTDVHLWGTIHANTVLSVPGDVRSPLPDLGLLNDGGYPFTGFQDLSQMGLVLPDQITQADLNVMLQFLSRMGRISASKTGIQVTVNRSGQLPEAVKKDRHLVLIGTRDQHALMRDVESKLHLLLTGQISDLKGPDQAKLVQLQLSGNQSGLEQMLSPWNPQRVAMLLSGANNAALDDVANLFAQDSQFASIQPGNVAVTTPTGPKSLVLLDKGEAKFLYPQDLRPEDRYPLWSLILVGLLALVGAFSLLGRVFRRR